MKFKVGDLVGHMAYPHWFGIVVEVPFSCDVMAAWFLMRRVAAIPKPAPPPPRCSVKNLRLLARGGQQ